MDFIGAKLAVFLGDKVLVILRDDKPDIPFPGYWDLPGGGRENDETPAQCALRETEEEVGLKLEEIDLLWSRSYEAEGKRSWFFVTRLPADMERDIRFGDEGQRWALMDAETFCAHPKAVPNFKSRLLDYLGEKSVDLWE
ncbi:NUDIX hydrolase [Epibacterium ulvae]|uniref:NUDIX hydrolase n=1 Tax=Epibacterium ulvae TaxID=1156985 RepID=UPI0024912656|nr:NUDIX hydrolase [Epibacterium ulvae]